MQRFKSIVLPMQGKNKSSLTDKEADTSELIEKVDAITQAIFSGNGFESKSLLADTALRWYEEIRPIDAFCCANRMRGLSFLKGQ